MRTIHLSTFRQQFAALGRAQPDLAGFTDPVAVLDVLHDWHGDADAKDRILTMPRSDRLAERNRLELLDVARVAYRAAERGLAHLVQVRHGPDQFAYLLIARPRPRRGAGSLADLVTMEAV